VLSGAIFDIGASHAGTTRLPCRRAHVQQRLRDVRVA
jgi:hypothetical protein